MKTNAETGKRVCVLDKHDSREDSRRAGLGTPGTQESGEAGSPPRVMGELERKSPCAQAEASHGRLRGPCANSTRKTIFSYVTMKMVLSP